MKNTADIFWQKVEKTETCWLWRGWTINSGYGMLSWNNKKILAHRLAWQLTHNSIIPVKMDICHTCDVKLCCRPDHLYLGSRSENNLDIVHRGRWRGNQVFTAEFVSKIKQHLLERRLMLKDIAIACDAPLYLVKNVAYGLSWREVDPQVPRRYQRIGAPYRSPNGEGKRVQRRRSTKW